ncbi:Arrestin domain-containing protein 4 [Blyttiomyces sp. JEL0837]|nr:Arrestin domain-containing protein 4 [Blyttiomyces sp. JEL0837]
MTNSETHSWQGQTLFASQSSSLSTTDVESTKVHEGKKGKECLNAHDSKHSNLDECANASSPTASASSSELNSQPLSLPSTSTSICSDKVVLNEVGTEVVSASEQSSPIEHSSSQAENQQQSPSSESDSNLHPPQPADNQTTQPIDPPPTTTTTTTTTTASPVEPPTTDLELTDHEIRALASVLENDTNTNRTPPTPHSFIPLTPESYAAAIAANPSRKHKKKPPKVSLFKIALDGNRTIFMPGQRVEVPAITRLLRVRFTGTVSTRVYKDEHTMMNTTSSVILFKEMTTLSGSLNVQDPNEVLQPGEYVFPFTFRMPSVSLPASFESHYGKIKYEITAVLVRSGSLNKTHTVVLTVPSTLDGTGEAFMVPVKVSEGCVVGRLWWASGRLEVEAEIPKRAYTSEESIPLRIDITNHSGSGCVLKGVYLKQKVMYKTTTEIRGPLTERIHKLNFTEHFPPYTRRICRVIHFPIPPITTFSPTIKTSLIEVSHFLIIKVSPSSSSLLNPFQKTIKVSVPVVIAGFPNTIANVGLDRFSIDTLPLYSPPINHGVAIVSRNSIAFHRRGGSRVSGVFNVDALAGGGGNAGVTSGVAGGGDDGNGNVDVNVMEDPAVQESMLERSVSGYGRGWGIGMGMGIRGRPLRSRSSTAGGIAAGVVGDGGGGGLSSTMAVTEMSSGTRSLFNVERGSVGDNWSGSGSDGNGNGGIDGRWGSLRGLGMVRVPLKGGGSSTNGSRNGSLRIVRTRSEPTASTINAGVFAGSFSAGDDVPVVPPLPRLIGASGGDLAGEGVRMVRQPAVESAGGGESDALVMMGDVAVAAESDVGVAGQREREDSVEYLGGGGGGDEEEKKDDGGHNTGL